MRLTGSLLGENQQFLTETNQKRVNFGSPMGPAWVVPPERLVDRAVLPLVCKADAQINPLKNPEYLYTEILQMERGASILMRALQEKNFPLSCA
jgi:hypothetical protein